MERRRFIAGTIGATSSALLLSAGAGIAMLQPAQAVEPAAPPLEQRLASYAQSIRYHDLPAEVITAAKRVLIDTIGCAFGAVGSEPGNIAEATIRQTFGDGTGATIIGYARPATIEGATFVNGVLVRSLDLNDTYLGTEPLHPSELLPAALAIAEEAGRGGRELVEAIVAGYEASCRITDAISFIERGFHPLCAMSYGAPLIAGKLWDLTPEALAHAVGISGARGTTSFVVNSGAISMMKAMGFAATAADAILATRLAARGFTGPAGTLEWFAAKTSTSKRQVDVDLRPDIFRLPNVAFKRFPIQIELAAVAEAGSALAPRLAGRIDDITEITVESYPGIIERVADAPKFKPETKGTADHSLPVSLALALIDGDVTVSQFENNRWRDPDVMRLVERTRVIASEDLMRKRPKGRGTRVEIRLIDGSWLRETVEVPEGDAERPLSQASLERKFTTFATPVTGASNAGQILQMVKDLEHIDDVRVLARALRGAGKQRAT